MLKKKKRKGQVCLYEKGETECPQGTAQNYDDLEMKNAYKTLHQSLKNTYP